MDDTTQLFLDTWRLSGAVLAPVSVWWFRKGSVELARRGDVGTASGGEVMFAYIFTTITALIFLGLLVPLAFFLMRKVGVDTALARMDIRAEFEAELAESRNKIDELRDKYLEAVRKWGASNDDAISWRNTNANLRLLLWQAEKVLRPFAKAADLLPEEDVQDVTCVHSCAVEAADLRAAASVAKKIAESKE